MPSFWIVLVSNTSGVLSGTVSTSSACTVLEVLPPGVSLTAMLSPSTFATTDVYSLTSGSALAVIPGTSDAVGAGVLGIGLVLDVGLVSAEHAANAVNTTKAP